MQENIPPAHLFVSYCPVCGTRLLCGEIIKNGFHQCGRCKSNWIIEINAEHVYIMAAPKS